MATATKQPTLVRAMQFLKKNGIKGLATNKELEAYLKKHGVPIAHWEPMNNGDSIWCVESELAATITPNVPSMPSQNHDSDAKKLRHEINRIAMNVSVIMQSLQETIKHHGKEIDAYNHLVDSMQKEFGGVRECLNILRDAVFKQQILQETNIKFQIFIMQQLGVSYDDFTAALKAERDEN